MTQTVSIRLDEETIRKLDLMAKAADRSRAWLMSQAVRQYVEHEAWQIDAIKNALEKFETGQAQFVNHEEVLQWIATWGTDEEKEGPLC